MRKTHDKASKIGKLFLDDSLPQPDPGLDKSAPHVPFQDTPVTVLKGVGPRSAERLARIGIHSVQDLLFHLPLRYEDRTRVTPIGALRPGDPALIEAQVEHSEVRMGRRRSLLLLVADGSGSLLLRFFHFSAAQQEGLRRGVRLRCYGEVRQGPASLEIIHPEYRRVEDESPQVVEESLTPVYPTTEGMHQLSWRALIGHALKLLEADSRRLLDWLSPDLMEPLGLPPLLPALQLLHRPPPDVDLAALAEGAHPAQRRLAFEELLAHQIGLRRLRLNHRKAPAPRLAGDGRLRQRLLERLPFTLTDAQQRVAAEIAADLVVGRPMLRLVQGDVGSGKTVVAALAALQAVEADHQVALMAPTELLAEQHLRSFQAWLAPLDVVCVWLTGRLRGRERQTVLQAVADGSARVIIGTHALFQTDVVFGTLGLAIVDEQHRFGVHQRLALRQKGVGDGGAPHQLIMTATPIPRSLAMTAYADLDLSVIDRLPPGRTPVTTVALPDSRRDEVIARVREACAVGRQAYWVCTLIEESEALQCQAAEESAALLRQSLGDIPVGLVHGRLKPAEREQVMAEFKAGELGLLVATTVIEVGVDVPNASLMIIENPERLGLAQLHQLRGRVGRGTAESHCLLMYHAPLSHSARARLGIIRHSSDGFVIARKDLELRGPGEVLGTRQTGEMQFRIADPLRHQGLLPEAQRVADRLLRDDPRAGAALEARWLDGRKHYAGV
jgi:ATP-dependent DNA helicase RecG